MPDLNSIKTRIIGMSRISLGMWQVAFQAFMDHDTDLISKVLDEENKLNNLEKELTVDLIGFGRTTSSKDEKNNVIIYTDIVGDLELIGDYCKDSLERLAIKIEEKLLFSEDAVKEYAEVYQKAQKALVDVVLALEKEDPDFIKELAKKAENIDSFVDELRRRHNQRLLDGKCSPLACNMFLNMLDFTSATYFHAKKIIRNLQKINR